MRKILMTFATICLAANLMAGGLVTNTNQSAYFTRMLSRNASTAVDAVYFNPAGLTKLGNGFHFSINNQTLGQTKTIINDYAYLNATGGEYTGKVSAPFFPGIYAAFKMGKIVFSAGFNPIGGGGGAEYAAGLPSFDMMVADLVPGFQNGGLKTLDDGLAGMGFNTDFSNVPAYNADILFEGSSIYFGYQANVSYEINDMISVALGARYVAAKNTYKGSISGVTITSASAMPGVGGTYTPGDYLRLVAAHPLAIAAGAAAQLNGEAAYLDVATSVEADVVEEGSGFTPIISVNISPMDMLNLSIRYEHSTKLELDTKVIDGKDAGGMFVDESVKVADMPAMLALGAQFSPMDKLMLSASATTWFDKNNDYDGSLTDEFEMIDKNFISYSLGAEYGLSKLLKISAGYSGTSTGVNDLYQSDLRYSLNTSTFGGGFGISVTPMIDINIGAMYTMYNEGSVTSPYDIGGLGLMTVPVTETYDTETWAFAVGVDLHF